MEPVRIAIAASEPRALVTLVGATIVPRLVERDARSAHVALVAGGALLLGGDRVDIAIAVGDGCTLDLEDVGGTVAYSADGVACFWDVEIDVGAGARLTWNGLPLIVAEGANVHRNLRMRLGAGASALVRESIVLGRSGERGGRLRLHTSVRDGDGPVVEEALDADGAHPVPGVLGAHRVLDTILCAGDRPPPVRVDGVTVMALEAPGATARYLGDHAHSSPLAAVWRDWSAAPAAEERGTP